MNKSVLIYEATGGLSFSRAITSQRPTEQFTISDLASCFSSMTVSKCLALAELAADNFLQWVVMFLSLFTNPWSTSGTPTTSRPDASLRLSSL